MTNMMITKSFVKMELEFLLINGKNVTWVAFLLMVLLPLQLNQKILKRQYSKNFRITGIHPVEQHLITRTTFCGAKGCSCYQMLLYWVNSSNPEVFGILPF